MECGKGGGDGEVSSGDIDDLYSFGLCPKDNLVRK